MCYITRGMNQHRGYLALLWGLACLEGGKKQMFKGVLQEVKVLLHLTSFSHGTTFSLFCCFPQLCIALLTLCFV